VELHLAMLNLRESLLHRGSEPLLDVRRERREVCDPLPLLLGPVRFDRLGLALELLHQPFDPHFCVLLLSPSCLPYDPALRNRSTEATHAEGRVLSLDAVTMCLPSGLHAADLTSPSWPRRTTAPVPSAFHTRAVLSRNAVTMRLPSGLHAA